MWLFALASLIVGGVGCLFFRRSSSSVVVREVDPLIERDRHLLSITSPAGFARCTAVLGLQSHRFTAAELPHLPLAGCTMANDCRCRYQLVPERRVGSRRSGEDRRALIRYDPQNPPRRRGPGRRQEDWLCWPGVQLPPEQPSEAKPAAPEEVSSANDASAGRSVDRDDDLA